MAGLIQAVAFTENLIMILGKMVGKGGGERMIVVLHLVDVNALFVEGVSPKMFCVKVAKYETQKP